MSIDQERYEADLGRRVSAFIIQGAISDDGMLAICQMVSELTLYGVTADEMGHVLAGRWPHLVNRDEAAQGIAAACAENVAAGLIEFRRNKISVITVSDEAQAARYATEDQIYVVRGVNENVRDYIRHFFATCVDANGWPLVDVELAWGHADTMFTPDMTGDALILGVLDTARDAGKTWIRVEG